MTETISQHWLLEYREEDHATNASGIDNSSRFEDKETAKEAGEMLVGLQNYQWENLENHDGEQLMVTGTLVRVRRDTDKIHEHGEIPHWCEIKKRHREFLDC